MNTPNTSTAQIKSDLTLSYNLDARSRDAGEQAVWKLTLRELFMERLLAEQASRMLEIGAGPGKDSRFFAAHGLQTTASDLSPSMAGLCHEKGLPACTADLYWLPFAPLQFDAVWSMNCLLHVPRADLKEVLRSIHWVLRPGGLFHFGAYGGIDHEGIYEQDHLRPQRYFSFLTDDHIREIVKLFFQIESFKTIPVPEEKTLHFQSLILRRR